MSTRKIGSGLKSDTALAALGCCLAVGSATFGVLMTVHGPATSFGTGGGFSVFAQLAPRTPRPARTASAAKTSDLDLTATASIPRPDRAPNARAATPTVTLQTASKGVAVVVVDGQTAVVHVGDEIPGMGEVLAIMPGAEPEVRTEHGVISAAADH